MNSPDQGMNVEQTLALEPTPTPQAISESEPLQRRIASLGLRAVARWIVRCRHTVCVGNGDVVVMANAGGQADTT